MKSMQFDYVIAGAGTAGCVLANRLSADPQIRVLLLEAGGRDDWIWIHIPVGYLYCIGNPRTDWCYRTEPDPGLNGRSILYARGKVLGGCSSINAMLYLRGQARDYDEWARITGDAAWGWDSVLPVFRKSEDYFGGADEAHGAGGEWRVERQRLSWEILEHYREAMVQAGIPRSDDFNRGDNEGCGFFLVNQKRGVRWNTSKAFLRPVMNRPNLSVVTGAHVLRLRMAGRRCTGIEFRRAGEDAFAEARLETILATGSIGSPQILQLSGIGPAPLLREHGIGVVHELPGVGENLQDHLQLRTISKVRNAVTLNQRANSVIGKMMMGLEYALWRTGPLTMAPASSAASPAVRASTRRRTSRFTCSRFRWTSSANRCTASPRSPPARATFGRLREALCASSRPIRTPRRQSTAATCPRRRTARSPPIRCASRAASQSSPRSCATRRRNSCRGRNSSPTTSWRASPGTSAPRFSIRSAPAGWARRTMRPPSSIRGCACGAPPGCAWSTHRSCPPLLRATPTRPR